MGRPNKHSSYSVVRVLPFLQWILFRGKLTSSPATDFGSIITTVGICEVFYNVDDDTIKMLHDITQTLSFFPGVNEWAPLPVNYGVSQADRA